MFGVWFIDCKDQSLKQNKQRKKVNKYKRVKARDLENHARNNAQTH